MSNLEKRLRKLENHLKATEESFSPEAYRALADLFREITGQELLYPGKETQNRPEIVKKREPEVIFSPVVQELFFKITGERLCEEVSKK